MTHYLVTPLSTPLMWSSRLRRWGSPTLSEILQGHWAHVARARTLRQAVRIARRSGVVCLAIRVRTSRRGKSERSLVWRVTASEIMRCRD